MIENSWIILAVSAVVVSGITTYLVFREGAPEETETAQEAIPFSITLDDQVVDLFIQPTNWSEDIEVTTHNQEENALKYGFN